MTKHGQVQFYAYTPATLPPPDTTPFLQAFREASDLVTIAVRGKDGAIGSITITHDEAMRFSMALGASKFIRLDHGAHVTVVHTGNA